jgi:hypothetical protein
MCVLRVALNARLCCVHGIAGKAGAAMVAPTACLGAERRQGSRRQANSVCWDTANKDHEKSAQDWCRTVTVIVHVMERIVVTEACRAWFSWMISAPSMLHVHCCKVVAHTAAVICLYVCV